MGTNNVVLSPVQELAPGEVAAIRNSAIKATVDKASRELSLPKNKLVVRDIRALSDLDFGNNTDYMEVANTDNIWGTFAETGAGQVEEGGAGSYKDAISDNKTMTDQRYVCIYGVRDLRQSRPGAAETEKTVSLIRFDIGNAHRAIWDITQIEGYMDAVAGVTPSAIIIPPLAAYQISPYVGVDTKEPGIQLMGVVVEPAGLLVSPLTRTEEATEAIQTHMVPVMELAPGELGKIRNASIEAVVAQAMSELNLPREKLVVRDIRPYSDIGWATHATSGAASNKLWNLAVSTVDSWLFAASGVSIATLLLDGTYAYPTSATAFYDVVASGSQEMADARYVGIYGMRDSRMCLATPIEKAATLFKIEVGGNDRVIWDLQSMDAYRNAMAAVCPTVVTIPQNTTFQFGLHTGYTTDNAGGNLNLCIMPMGFVVEVVGKVLSP